MQRLFKIVFILFLGVLSCYKGNAQQYYPTSIKSAFFNETEKLLFEAGINNYALDFSTHYQVKRFIFSFQYDYNNAQLKFNPLNFYAIEVDRIERHKIQSKANQAKYMELKFAYNVKAKKKKIEIGFGIGRNLILDKNRYFTQIGLGNENRFIDMGLTLRGSYVENLVGFDLFNPITLVPINAVVLEPSIQGKIKIGRFRIINQFGFAMLINKAEDYMKPNFRIGIGYKY